MVRRLSSAERGAIEEHKYLMSEAAGHDVGFEAAARDWEAHHAARWRRERQAAMLSMQRDEIHRHLWIESEKAQRDLGTQAKLDWIGKHAAQWREWYDREYGMGEA